MKKYFKQISTAIFICTTLLFVTCKKDIAPEPCTDPLNPDCINYHPCNGVQPVTADFEMWSVYYGKNSWVMVEEDSIFPTGAIMFKAKLNNAAYQWQLGKETLTVQQDYRVFSNLINMNPPDTSAWGTYYNTLTVRKKPNLSCYPTNDTIATLTRSITIQKPSKLLTSGKFKVLYNGDKDSTIIQFQPWGIDFESNPNYTKESEGQRLFIGLRGGYADTIVMDNYFFTNKKIMCFDFNAFRRPCNGEINVNPSTYEVVGHYDIHNLGTGKITYQFKGRKL